MRTENTHGLNIGVRFEIAQSRAKGDKIMTSSTPAQPEDTAPTAATVPTVPAASSSDATPPEAPSRPDAAPATPVTAALPPVPPVQPGYPPAGVGGPMPYGGLPYGAPAYPFAASPKPPRERWINPAKRVPFIVVSIVAALVLLFIGVAVGHGVERHREVRFGGGAVEHQNSRQFGQYGPGGNQNGIRGQLPNRARPGASSVPGRTAAPQPSAPAVSGSATS